MTKFTVTWLPDAEDELANLWVAAPDPSSVTAAANQIDKILRRDADQQGQPLFERRHLVCIPLEVVFKVCADDRLVTILSVRGI